MTNNSLKKLIIFAVAIFLAIIPDLFKLNNDLSYDARITLRMVIFMISLWLTEGIPISVTALIPIIISPFFFEIESNVIIKNYASPVVFLLLGGFILAQGFEKSNLHQRIALKTLIIFGKTKEKILISVILSTAFFSMWLSNTATCLLMLPIIKNIIDNNFYSDSDFQFSKILILSIAYASSIGGIATPIGTIPNAILIGYLKENNNIDIDFVEWFKYAFPLVLILLILLFLFLRSRFVDNKRILKNKFLLNKYKSLGSFSYKEKTTIFILLVTLSLWIFKNNINEIFRINLTDPAIAIFGSFLFFIIPFKKNESILDSNWFAKIPWNILILFGGGLSMANLIVSSGLANEISDNLNIIKSFKIFFVIIFIALITSLMTEFTSNTATTFLLLPILSIFAINNSLDVLTITLPFVFAASCAFMMPIATPPNAIIYSSNKFNISFMVSNGFFINIICVLVISIYVFYFNIGDI